VREPELVDTRFTRVGKLDELVSRTLRRLYLKDVVDRGPGPRQHEEVVIGTASSRSDDAIGNSQLKILNTPIVEAHYLYTQHLN
jgi:hypothetical protein